MFCQNGGVAHLVPDVGKVVVAEQREFAPLKLLHKSGKFDCQVDLRFERHSVPYIVERHVVDLLHEDPFDAELIGSDGGVRNEPSDLVLSSASVCIRW